VPTKLFYCKIEPKHLEVGIKGSSPYLNESITNRGRERVWLCIYRHINVCTRARYYQNNQRGQRGLGQWILDKTKVFHSSTKHDLMCPVKVDSSFWTLEDDVMHITLHKRETGQTWPLPRYGQGELDPLSVDQEQRRFMLQRFQEEARRYLSGNRL